MGHYMKMYFIHDKIEQKEIGSGYRNGIKIEIEIKIKNRDEK